MKIKKKKNFGGGGRVRGVGLVGGGVRVDVNEELKVFVKIQKKKKFFGGGGGSGGVGLVGGGQGGCEQRIKVFLKFKNSKKNNFFWGGGRGVGGGGVRVNVNEELKFL